MKSKPIIIVQGGQWGSEAKGAVTAALCSKRAVDYCVRTGCVNAGHTVIHRGLTLKMQQIPCGFVNPRTNLVIGAGAFIYPAILASEIHMLTQTLGEDVRRRLFIDFRCGLHLPTHQAKAKVADRHHIMGATGKGCSEAIVEKISGRGTTGRLFFDWLHSAGPQQLMEAGVPADLQPYLTGLNSIDTERMLNTEYDNGFQILIEATQGTLLDIHLGPYPYTTHKQTVAAQWATECGLSPALEYEVVLVMRTYPIRVAGNSGPMPRETDWVTLAQAINDRLVAKGLSPMVKEDSLAQFTAACKDFAKHKWGTDKFRIEYTTQTEREANKGLVSELHKTVLEALPGPVIQDLERLFEMTTVTRKLRRIAQFDIDCARESIRQNRPAYIVLTFLNYWYPEYWNCDKPQVVMADEEVAATIAHYERIMGVPIRYVTTGPETKHVLDVSLGSHKAAMANASGK